MHKSYESGVLEDPLHRPDRSMYSVTRDPRDAPDAETVIELEFKKSDNKIVLGAPDDFKHKAVYEILQSKLVRRKVPLKNLKPGNLEPAGGSTVRQEIELQQGISTDTARAIVKFIKDRKIKRVQASIHGEQVRVSSPSRDALQTVMEQLREEDFGIELKFGNYRS